MALKHKHTNLIENSGSLCARIVGIHCYPGGALCVGEVGGHCSPGGVLCVVMVGGHYSLHGS